jgi:Papain family cysteine protease
VPYHPMTAARSAPVLISVLRPDGKVNFGEPAKLFAEHARIDHELFAAAGMLRTFAPAVASSYSLAQWQTPIRDQGDRGTCYVFACVAALEAAYRRNFGLSLDLSEQYACQLGKIGELYPNYATSTVPHESNTTLWGAQGNSGFLNVICRCAIPVESAAPYLDQEQLYAIWTGLGLPAFSPVSAGPSQSSTQEEIDAFEFDDANVPTAARSQASYRGTGYTPLNNFDTSDVEAAIAANHEVVLDINTYWSQDSSGVWQYDASATAQGHCVLVVGYDRNAQIFTFKNSWGGTSLSQMSYDCLQHIAVGATTLDGAVDPAVGPQASARWLGRWNSDHDGWRGTVVVRRVTDFRDSDASDATKLGNWYPPGESAVVLDPATRRDMNGSLAENGRQANYWIAPTSARVQPGQQTGQPFTVYNFSWESSAAAGVCSWNNLLYGVIVDRQPIAGTPGTTDENGWVGTWDMDHDGWLGTLNISGLVTIPLGTLLPLTLVEASYKASDGTVSPVNGIVDAADSQHLLLTIDFPGNSQPFQLYKYSWERDNAAGTTQWGGSTFGVRLHKNS